MSGLNNPGWDQAARTRGQPTALQVGASLGDGLMGSFDEGGLSIVSDVTAPGFWAKITGRSGNFYSWTEVQQDGTGQNWITAMSPLISGGSSANTVYNAYEENGSTTVANNTVVWMRRTQGLGGEAFAFKHQPPPAATPYGLSSAFYTASGLSQAMNSNAKTQLTLAFGGLTLYTPSGGQDVLDNNSGSLAFKDWGTNGFVWLSVVASLTISPLPSFPSNLWGRILIYNGGESISSGSNKYGGTTAVDNSPMYIHAAGGVSVRGGNHDNVNVIFDNAPGAAWTLTGVELSAMRPF